MNPYIKLNQTFEAPSHAEIHSMLQRGRRVRAEALAEGVQSLARVLRSLIATCKDRSRQTAEALASKPQGSLT